MYLQGLLDAASKFGSNTLEFKFLLHFQFLPAKEQFSWVCFPEKTNGACRLNLEAYSRKSIILFPRKQARENCSELRGTKMQEKPEVIDVAELMKDHVEEEEMDLEDYNDNKKNIGPCLVKPQQHNQGVFPECEEKKIKVNIPLFQKLNLNSDSLFNPNLLAADRTSPEGTCYHDRRTKENLS
ncbi:hypothetical protein VNO80_05404 [Phaseolus coccineus]|uniref:Uncharacterized protein n=1 Tax=Phaseolus coccineus TaxID=3886 RepID=A0AAN9RGP1_PHACN